MKKTNHYRAWTGLMACLLAVTAWMFYGCKNEMKEMDYWYPTEKLYLYSTTNELGTFLYSDKEDSWIIVSDSVLTISNDTIPERVIVYEILNDGLADDATIEEYKNFIGEKVIFSGKYINIGVGTSTEYSYLIGDGYILRGFRPQDVNISIFESRSVITEIVEAECGTKPTPRKHIDNCN